MRAGPVPAALRSGEDFIAVNRAWPHSRTSPEGHQVVLVEGADTLGRVRAAQLRLRAVPDRGWDVARASVLDAGRDPKLPDLRRAAQGGTVVVHRYGRRAVIRLPDRYVKVVRPGSGPRIASQADRGHTLANRAGFAAPTVLGAGDGQAEFSLLAGTSLHELGRTAPLDRWCAWWGQWAQSWPELTAGDGSGLEAHPASAEVVNLRRWTERVVRLAAVPAAAEAHLLQRADDVCTRLTAGAGQPLVVSHRDLHDKQVLADGASLGLLDFDTAARAEPALDLANLLVHARLRRAQGLWSPEHATVAEDAVAAVADTLAVDPARLALYAEATRLRLACLYAFRPRHRELALSWATHHPKMREFSSSSHHRAR